MKNKIKIGFFISSKIIGGGEKLLLTIVEKISNEFESHVVCYPNSILKQEFLKRTPYVYGVSNYDNADIRAFSKYCSIMYKNKFDIVHAHLNRASFHVQYAAKLLGIPSISTMHGYDNPFYYKFHDRIIVSNKILKERLFSQNIKNVSVIFNGIDIEKFKKVQYSQALLSQFNINKNDKIIAIISRLHKNKGQLQFIESMHEYILKNDIKVLVVGDGEYKNIIQKKIIELKLFQNVFLTGQIKNIPAVLKTSKIVCLPSLRENQPVVISEAMASGVPCIVSDVGNNRDIMDRAGSGIVYKDKESLIDGLNKLFTHRQYYDACSENGIKFAHKYLDEKNMVLKHESLYKKILKK